MSTSLKKSWKVKGCVGARDLMGVRASLCLPLWLGRLAGAGGVLAALVAERVMTGHTVMLVVTAVAILGTL